jgi:hypothetical protein
MNSNNLEKQIFTLCKECKLPYPHTKFDKELDEDYLILSFNTSNDDFNNFDLEKVFIKITNNQINNFEKVKTQLMKLYDSVYNYNIKFLNELIPNFCPIKYLELYNTSKNIYDIIIKHQHIPIPTMYIDHDFKIYSFIWENAIKIEFLYNNGVILIDDNQLDDNEFLISQTDDIIKYLETFFKSYYPI